MSAIHDAARGGHLDVVKTLIADINVTDEYGNTALHEASENGQLEVVKYLLENGADDTIENWLDYTARDVSINDVAEYFARMKK